MPAPLDEFFLDTRIVRRAFDAASGTFDAAAAVHAEIRRRLMERLDVVRLEPEVVIDLGAGTGHASRALRDRYSSARVIAVDLSPRMLRRAGRQRRLFRGFERLAADAHQLPLQNGAADLIFSNLMLQWCSDPDRVFAEMRRVLRANGLVTFTTLGPDSLRELRAVWARADAHTHVHRFIDMHDLGDALLRAGFAEPVMDTERLTITYPNFDSLLQELRDSGSNSAAHGRRRTLVGRSTMAHVREAYESMRSEGVLPVTLEVVYGHAWAIDREPRGARRGEVSIPLREVRRRVE